MNTIQTVQPTTAAKTQDDDHWHVSEKTKHNNDAGNEWNISKDQNDNEGIFIMTLQFS